MLSKMLTAGGFACHAAAGVSQKTSRQFRPPARKIIFIRGGISTTMSKAFTREPETEDEEPDAPDSVPAGVKNYITPQGLAGC